MTRVLPYPLAAAALLAIWLLLNESIAPGTLLLGAVLALAAARMLRRLDVPGAAPRRPLVASLLAVRVLGDVVEANFAAARIVFGRRRNWRSGFVRIPLEMQNPHGLAALACIITATPGTLWVEYESVRGTLLLHVLDLVDEDAVIATIKGRYERPLMEIFE